MRKVVSNEKRELKQHELWIRIHRTESIYGLIRNLVFQDNRRCIFRNRLVLQYYVNKEICGNIDSVTYQLPNHGNTKIEKSFDDVKKVL